MKMILLFVCVLLFSSTSFANEMMERVVECNRVAMGAMMRIVGHGGEVKWYKKGTIPENNEEFTKEQLALVMSGMFVRDDGETPEEKQEWEEHLTAGWKLEDAWIRTHAGQPKDPKAVLEACMQQHETYKGLSERHWRIYQTASSAKLMEPFTDVEHMCAFRAEVMHRAVPMVQQYKTTAEMFKDWPFPEGWSDELKAICKKDVEDVFGFVGNAEVLIRTRYQQCMGMI